MVWKWLCCLFFQSEPMLGDRKTVAWYQSYWDNNQRDWWGKLGLSFWQMLETCNFLCCSMFLCQCIYSCAALLANFLCQCLFFTVQFHPEFYPNMFCWPPFSPCLNCLFLFCHASLDCRLALIVSNFLGALRQTHQHLKGKYIIPHYYSSAFFFLFYPLYEQQTQQHYYPNQERMEFPQLMQY